ncbi:MAG: glycosyltransferase, partial [Halothiobacillus sp.]|nr:glycosyltransferase [Halothiobacillus sp.]
MEAMRVLFVLPRMLAGGVERVTLNLVASLQAEGIECRLALRRCHGEFIEEAKALVDVEELAGDGLHHFVPRLARLISDWHPSHVVTAFADVGLMTLLACRLAGDKTALIHGVHNTHSFANRRPGITGLIRYGLDDVMARALYRRADWQWARNGGATITHGWKPKSGFLK